MQNFFRYFLITLYLTIGFIPSYGSIDKVQTQHLYLSLLNILSFGFIIYTGQRMHFKKFIWTEYFFLTVFTIWSFISLIYSINKIETTVNLIRLLTFLFSGYLILKLLSKVKLNIVLLIYLAIFIVEVSLPLKVYFEIVKTETFVFKFSNYLKTFTGNKNITAAIIAFKLPFLLYFFSVTNNKFLKFLLIILQISAFYLLVLLSSRAALLSSTIFILIVPMLLLFKIKKFKLKSFAPYIIYSFSFLTVTLFSYYNFDTDNTISLKQRALTVNTKDASASQRLRFYKHGLTHIKNNPIIGLGLGNWKTKSIEYDKDNIQSYIVPYHLHNDFLQYFTELGLFGFLFYLATFLVAFKNILKRLFSSDKFYFNLLLLGSLLVFFVDSNLNFPYQRPIQMINFLFLISMIHNEKE